MEVPGYKPEDIEVSVQEGYLTVFAKRGKEHLRRTWSLSDDIDVEKIEAKAEHGLLTITLPRVKRDVRKITVKGPSS